MTVLYSDRPPEELSGYTGFLLSYLGERARRTFFSVLEPHGFHPREFGVLTVLAKRPGITQQELASLARVDPSSMVALVDDLEARGVAERRVDPQDRRRRTLYVTDKGRDQMRVLQREARKAAAQLLGALTDEESETLNRLLRKLAGLDDG